MRYYIFVEPNQSRKSDRQFYESLLKSLEGATTY